MTPKTFSNRVRQIVARIPRGQVMTYSQVADAAGSPRACRAVGNIMKGNFDLNIPCHRVICADGSLGGYNRGGNSVKENKLKSEGVQINRHRVVLKL